MKEKAKPERILESDLYQPVVNLLQQQGYIIRGEVKNCDITAVNEDELVIVELKTGFNATLLVQAAKRQRIADRVYIAIPRPKGGLFSKKWKDICYLIRRLELGLILVALRGPNSTAEVAFDPAPFDKSHSQRLNRPKRKKVLAEIDGRHADYNTGGSCRQQLMTAYRENSLQIGVYLRVYGMLPPRRLKELGTGSKTGSILQKNYYGWFEKVGHGVYQLSPEGLKNIAQYPELEDYYLRQLSLSSRG